MTARAVDPTHQAHDECAVDPVGQLLAEASRAYVALLRSEVSSLRVAVGAVPVLVLLLSSSSTMWSVAYLAERLAVSQSTISFTIGRMERDGLVNRVQDSPDQRYKSILPTPRAQALRRQLTAAQERCEAALTAGTTAEDQQILRTILRRFTASPTTNSTSTST